MKLLTRSRYSQSKANSVIALHRKMCKTQQNTLPLLLEAVYKRFLSFSLLCHCVADYPKGMTMLPRLSASIIVLMCNCYSFSWITTVAQSLQCLHLTSRHWNEMPPGIHFWPGNTTALTYNTNAYTHKHRGTQKWALRSQHSPRQTEPHEYLWLAEVG